MRVRRFDSELSAAQEEVQRERSLREKLAREKDMLAGDAFSLRQQLEVRTMKVRWVFSLSPVEFTSLGPKY